MKLMAIDGNSILNRAFYGVRLLSNKDGVFTNAVFGFLNIFLKLLKEHKPDAVAVAFDVSRTTFRHEQYSEYKANRHGMPEELRMQLPLIKAKGIAVGSVHFLPETMDQSLHIPRLFRKVFYSYLIQFYKSMDHLVTVNPCFIPKLAAYGIDPEKVTYIPNYVSAKRFSKVDEQRKKELRREWGLDPERFTVVCAGQLQTRKGVMEFAKIAERLPQMQFVWAGNFAFGNMSDGHRELEQLLQNHPKNLLFTGLVDREKMPQIYQMGDVMLLPSFDELFPMTVLEAMSCGLPILLRDLDLYRVILDGYYLKAQDNDGFVEQLLSLSTDSEYYARALQMSGEGNAFYSEEHVLSMWRQFYHQVMEESIRKQETFRKPLKKVLQMATGGTR